MCITKIMFFVKQYNWVKIDKMNERKKFVMLNIYHSL